jgi:hypothetical protein
VFAAVGPLAAGCPFWQVKKQKVDAWGQLGSHWATKARTSSAVLGSGGHVALRWPLEADFELFWALVAKWLPECIWKLILSCSGLWWCGFPQAAHFKSEAPWLFPLAAGCPFWQVVPSRPSPLWLPLLAG